MRKSKIKINVLGSGTMVPTKEKNPAGFLVEADNKKILLDVGHGIIRRITDFDIGIQDIDIIFISHFHSDHFGDAFNLIVTRFVDDSYRKKTHKKLMFIGPQTLEKRYKQWRKIYWPEPQEDYPLIFKQGPQTLKRGNIHIQTFSVKHVPWFPSVGIIIRFAGKKLVYTGDIGSKHDFNDLVEKTKNADLLITEASYQKPTPNHYTVEQIKKLADETNVYKVLIVHVRPQHEKQIQKICQKEPKFILGKDGLKLNM